jgi:hypothetical protein
MIQGIPNRFGMPLLSHGRFCPVPRFSLSLPHIPHATIWHTYHGRMWRATQLSINGIRIVRYKPDFLQYAGALLSRHAGPFCQVREFDLPLHFNFPRLRRSNS